MIVSTVGVDDSVVVRTGITIQITAGCSSVASLLDFCLYCFPLWFGSPLAISEGIERLSDVCDSSSITLYELPRNK